MIPRKGIWSFAMAGALALGGIAGFSRAADEPYTETASSISVQASSGAAAPVEPPAVEEPFVSPVGALKGRIVSRFGQRRVPGDPVKLEWHHGIDLRVKPNDPIRASRSGKVIFVGYSKTYVSRQDKTDQQHLVIVLHKDGKSSRYVHLNLLKVRPLQEVQAGDVLGTAVESDEWTEPVLHFEIRDASGKALNPEKLLVDLKTTAAAP